MALAPAQTLRPIPDQMARLRTARQTSDEFFLNARIDMFLAGEGSEADRVTETLRRAGVYLEAGTDGVFVPGAIAPATVAQLVAAIEAPVNIVVWQGAPTVAQLAASIRSTADDRDSHDQPHQPCTFDAKEESQIRDTCVHEVIGLDKVIEARNQTGR